MSRQVWCLMTGVFLWLAALAASCGEAHEVGVTEGERVQERALTGWLEYDSTVGQALTELAYGTSLGLPEPFCYNVIDVDALSPKNVTDLLDGREETLPTAVRNWVEDLLSFPDYRGFLMEDVPMEDPDDPGNYYQTDFLYLPNPTGSSRPLPSFCGSLRLDLGSADFCCCKLQGQVETDDWCVCDAQCWECDTCGFYGGCADCIESKEDAPALTFVEEECGGHPRFDCSVTFDEIPTGTGMNEACGY